MIMRNNVKNIETKLPLLRIIINIFLWSAGLAAVLGLKCACGSIIQAAVGMYLVCKLLRLITRFFILVLYLLFAFVSISILILIISLLIF